MRPKAGLIDFKCWILLNNRIVSLILLVLQLTQQFEKETSNRLFTEWAVFVPIAFSCSWIAALDFERLLTQNGWELLVLSHLTEFSFRLNWLFSRRKEKAWEFPGIIWREDWSYSTDTLGLQMTPMRPLPNNWQRIVVEVSEHSGRQGKWSIRTAGETHRYLKGDGTVLNLSYQIASCVKFLVSWQKLRQLPYEPGSHDQKSCQEKEKNWEGIWSNIQNSHVKKRIKIDRQHRVIFEMLCEWLVYWKSLPLM